MRGFVRAQAAPSIAARGDVPRQMIGWRLARVAGIGTAVVLVLYAAVMVGVDISLFRSMISDADGRVAAKMISIGSDLRSPRVFLPQDVPQPVFLWLFGPDGKVVLATQGAPDVPSGLRPVRQSSLDLPGGHHLRVAGAPLVDLVTANPVGWLMAGTSVDSVYGALFNLALLEAGVAIPLGVLTFLGALWVARRSVAPVEEARRRQLAFTADASHELRTPLTVIEAEASLALQKDRDADSYRQSIQRIAGEGARLRRIVEDLLWLARFESEPSLPVPSTVDVGQVATESVARFHHVADQRGIQLRGSLHTPQPPLIPAPPEWIDRLVGVLVDNACRYAPDGGTVDVSVVSAEGRVRLAVDDSGPGIPMVERAQIFDRFHRANAKPGGAGLGLAIGNAIVSATGGRWEVTESPLGGARMAVHWTLLRGYRELEPSADTPVSGWSGSAKPIEDRSQKG